MRKIEGIYILILCTGYLLGGCQQREESPSSRLPLSLTRSVDAGEETMLAVLQFMDDNPSPRYFGEWEPDTKAETIIAEGEGQYVQVDRVGKGSYQYRSVYNIYEDEAGMREYAVLQFRVSVGDTNRKSVQDIRFKVVGDTAFYTDLSIAELAWDTSWVQASPLGEQRIHRLKSYGHQGDVEIGQIKYWTPSLGTLIYELATGQYIVCMPPAKVSPAEWYIFIKQIQAVAEELAAKRSEVFELERL